MDVDDGWMVGCIDDGWMDKRMNSRKWMDGQINIGDGCSAHTNTHPFCQFCFHQCFKVVCQQQVCLQHATQLSFLSREMEENRAK